MNRMHLRWTEMHPQLEFSQQHLRDYAAYLRRIGYVRAPGRNVEVVERALPLQHHDEVVHRPRLRDQVDLGTREGDLRSRVPLKPQDLTRMAEVLSEELPEDADIWQINCAVYNAAKELLQRHQQRETDSAYVKAQRRVHKLEAKIKSARQHASRIECVIQNIKRGQPFTTKIRRIAAGVRRQHHTLNLALLQIIKQHCLERIRALMTIKSHWEGEQEGLGRTTSFERVPLVYSNRLRVLSKIRQVCRLLRASGGEFMRCRSRSMKTLPQ